MSATIEIRTTDDGVILARRLDGMPLTPEDKEEAKRMAVNESVPTDDPLLSVDQWYPEFHRLHMAVVVEAGDFNYGWLRQNRPDLYQRIKAKEAEIDALEAARLSEVMAITADWRRLILKAELERRPLC